MLWGNGKREIVRQVGELVAQLKNGTYKSPFSQGFAEVYVENQKAAGSGEAVPERLPAPQHPADPKRGRFLEMRRLARISQAAGYLSGSNDRMQAILFYKQAKFMEDFEDDYTENAPFSMYFPSYQMMSYEQLRTYFTWRSGVRRGAVRRTSFSYVFLYLYELINNVGVGGCEDGLDKLAFLWKEYRPYEKKLDRYMREWIRDYYITNEFSAPFEELLQRAGLQEFFRPSEAESLFDFYCPYSAYKIEKSAFYTPEAAKTIRACFDHVVRSLDAFLLGRGAEFEDLIFYSKNGRWVPFSDALYCSFSGQVRNRVVKISDTEKYRCENGRWTSSRNKIPKENGRALMGYILKRIEQFFRRAAGYKYRLTADRKKVDAADLARLVPDPQSFFKRIDAAIFEYYRESKRKVVTVDVGRLETIRANAQRIQERLLADEGEAEPEAELPAAQFGIARPAAPEPPDVPAADAPAEADAWGAFARSLDGTEKAAVRMLLRGAPERELHAFCRESGVMPEVLVDGINRKALDSVSDTIIELSDTVGIFDEYREDLKRVIRIEGQ